MAMKRLFIIFMAMAMAMVLLAGCGVLEEAAEETGAAVTTQQTHENILFTVLEDQLLPPEENIPDAQLEEVYRQFKEAVANRDLEALDHFLDDEIRASFGSDNGKQAFYEFWESRHDAMWAEFDKIIALGGIFHEEEQRFTAPYTFRGMPDEFCSFEHFLVVGDGVNVYAQRNAGAGIIDRLSYNIISRENIYSDELWIAFWQMGDDGFVQVGSPSGAGYVQRRYIRSPIDYRFGFSRNESGEWKMTFMIAGD